jgi:hypothetical protein
MIDYSAGITPARILDSHAHKTIIIFNNTHSLGICPRNKENFFIFEAWPCRGTANAKVRASPFGA